ncbi:hypothetical protein E5288_WYG007585 [Bos mutus]|uniref:Uncharacterized protein n=1 Tax=Bos mutus TaxID=72004 RepID=A0A6B0RG48_9CETA|nr:hypothetical protein [Bos mutus]
MASRKGQEAFVVDFQLSFPELLAPWYKNCIRNKDSPNRPLHGDLCRSGPSVLAAYSSLKSSLMKDGSPKVHKFDLHSHSKFEYPSEFLWPGNQEAPVSVHMKQAHSVGCNRIYTSEVTQLSTLPKDLLCEMSISQSSVVRTQYSKADHCYPFSTLPRIIHQRLFWAVELKHERTESCLSGGQGRRERQFGAGTIVSVFTRVIFIAVPSSLSFVLLCALEFGPSQKVSAFPLSVGLC